MLISVSRCEGHERPSWMLACYSSPGKVLQAGGYLVLDSNNIGLVVATASRFYSVVQSLDSSSEKPKSFRVQVHSPQFLSAQWNYDVIDGASEWSIQQTNAEQNGSARFFLQSICTVLSKLWLARANPFVYLALLATIQLASALHGADTLLQTAQSGLKVNIVGDNDFYSQERVDVRLSD